MGWLPLTFFAGSFRDCASAISRIESDSLRKLLLSARAGEESRVEGLQAAADE